MIGDLETLKSIKRKARASYNCLRAIYSHKLATSSITDRKLFYEAITALDAMHSLYEKLKMGMRKEAVYEQIKFAKMWETYLACIDTLTAYRTNDKYLLSYVTTKDTYTAEIKALQIWNDYNRLVRYKNLYSGLNLQSVS